jgi:hypothetical protein
VSEQGDSVFARFRSRGEEVLTQLSGELMSNPQFAKAVQRALKGKQFLDDAASRALKQANIPTRTEFRRAVARVEALEAELEEVRVELSRLRKAAKASRSRARGEKAGSTKSARAPRKRGSRKAAD